MEWMMEFRRPFSTTAAPIGSFGIHLYCATVVPRVGRIKREGVALWQRGRTRNRNRRACKPHLEHRDFDVAKRPDPDVRPFVFPAAVIVMSDPPRLVAGHCE
jgi:hypothetical protein